MSKTDRFGKVTLGESNLITSVSEKNVGFGLINGGIYLMNKSLFKNKKHNEFFSFETNILEKVKENDYFRD